MRIAMIDNSRGWGGAEQMLLSLSSGLRSRGDDVHVVLREGAGTVEPFRGAGSPSGRFPAGGPGCWVASCSCFASSAGSGST
jgi:hypothetical protein